MTYCHPEFGCDCAEEIERLMISLREAEEFRARIEAAHVAHLRTGDYARLGMDTQDALIRERAA